MGTTNRNQKVEKPVEKQTNYSSNMNEEQISKLQTDIMLQEFGLLKHQGTPQKKQRKGNNKKMFHRRKNGKNGKLVSGSKSREGYLQVIPLKEPDFDPIRGKLRYTRTIRHAAV